LGKNTRALILTSSIALTDKNIFLDPMHPEEEAYAALGVCRLDEHAGAGF
jgi:hypothetical protein